MDEFRAVREKHMAELWHVKTDEQQDDIPESLRHRLDYDWLQFEKEYGTDSPQFKELLTLQKSELALNRQQTIMAYIENAMDLAWYNAEPIT
ncbi:MAG: hypothetical protein J0L80_15885 [Chitinophagales bacterium]|nr:hypothetical protein [Chitinophagales bacterium]